MNKSTSDLNEIKQKPDQTTITTTHSVSSNTANTEHSVNTHSTDEPERVGAASPARKPVSNVIHVTGLTRPFTLSQLKELLIKYGKIIDDKFWINNVKSHCFAVVSFKK